MIWQINGSLCHQVIMIQYLETCSPIFHSVSCWRSQAGIFLKKKKKKTKVEIIQKGKMGSLYWRKLGWVGWVGGGWSLKFKRGVAFIWHITSLNSEFTLTFKRGRVLSDTSPESKQWIYCLSSSKEEWCYLTNHQSLNSEFITSLLLKRECVYLTYYQSLIIGIFGLAVWHLLC